MHSSCHSPPIDPKLAWMPMFRLFNLMSFTLLDMSNSLLKGFWVSSDLRRGPLSNWSCFKGSLFFYFLGSDLLGFFRFYSSCSIMI